MDAIHDMGWNYSMFGHLIDGVKQCLTGFIRWQVKHVYCKANRAAHELAKLAIQQVNDNVWIEECPSCIEDMHFIDRAIAMSSMIQL
jgi:hypothetical protein